MAKENLGTTAGLLAAAALMLDYVLVVAVGISAGVGALVSAVPVLQPYTLPLCLAILALITLVNLRGVRESGVAFVVPTYLFIVSLLAVLAIGVVKAIAGRAAGRRRWSRRRRLPAAAAAASLWILMRSFASGCTAMTGVEAVSNGVGAFREPSVALRPPDPDGDHRAAGRHAGRHRLPVPGLRHRRDRAGPAGLRERPVAARRRGRRPGVRSTTSRSARCSACWRCRPTPASPTSRGSAG